MYLLFLRSLRLGKRECLGESLAKQELLIFFVRLMQAFEVRPPFDDPKNIPDEESAILPVQFLRTPILFKVKFIPREME